MKDQHYEIKPIAFEKFDDYYYMRKLSQLNQNLGFCATLADYSYAYRDQGQPLSAFAKAGGPDRDNKVVMAAFNAKGQTVGMAGLSFNPRNSKGAVMVYLWGVYVDKPHRGQGLAKRMIAASIAKITAALNCSNEDIVMTVMDSQAQAYKWNADAHALSVNLQGSTKGENRIDQSFGFNADPATISPSSKIPRAS